MAIAFSILTPEWLLQVTDAPARQPRALRLERHGAPGLLAWIGDPALLPALLPELERRRSADPSDLAAGLATEIGARVPPDEPGTALLAGWGVSPEGHAASWRWRISNFEGDGDDVGFQVDGTWLVPAFAQPGFKGRAKAKASFSVQVSTTAPLTDAIRRGVDKLPRDLRAEVDPSELAARLAGWVRALHPDAPAMIALQWRDGAFEGGLLDEAGVTPIAPGSETGPAALLPA
jgi:hypothetical protein